MKLIAIAMTLILSTAVSAQTPATTAVNSLFNDGTYTGYNGSEKCSVTISTTAETATITVINKNAADTFSIKNSAKNYKVKEDGSITATQSLNYPRYINGGTKALNINPDDINEVEFSVSQFLLDHNDNDMSTFVSCSVSRG